MASPVVPQSVPDKLISPVPSGLLSDHFIANYTPSPNDSQFGIDLLHALQTHAPLTLLQKFFLLFIMTIPGSMEWKLSIFDRGDPMELENVLELATDAWNYFPHKILGDKAPVEKL